jgi:hypothetical protein
MKWHISRRCQLPVSLNASLKSHLFALLVLVLILMNPLLASASTLEDYAEAQKIFLASAASMAAYDNRPGSLATEGFARQGWEVVKRAQVGNNADVQYILAWEQNKQSGRNNFLLAVAGTESNLDKKVDLRTRKIYFAGSTLEEFAANAARNDMPPEAPRVHEGFNQVAQLLLSMETVQSQGEQAGKSKLLTAFLRENPDNKVYLAGHSLGGAVVTLVAARLVDMGVSQEQIEVIALGAPTVGNEAFVQRYDGKFPLTRIVVEGDPVPLALRKIFGGYRHFGKVFDWPAPSTLQGYFKHNMTVYLDVAVKKYYSARRKAINEGVLPPSTPIAGKPRLYVAPIKNSLPMALQEEFAFMQEGLLEKYEDILPGFVLDSGKSYDGATMEKAAAAGCELVAVPEIHAVKLQNDDNTYYVSLIQAVYRVRDGKSVSLGTYGSSTKIFTPLEALLHNSSQMMAESAAWIDAK